MRKILLIATAFLVLHNTAVYANNDAIPEEVFSNLSIVLDTENAKREQVQTAPNETKTDSVTTPTPEGIDPLANFTSKLEYKRDRNHSSLNVNLTGLEEAKISEAQGQIAIEIADSVLEQNGLFNVISQEAEFNDRLISTHQFIDGEGVNQFIIHLRDNVTYSIDKNSTGIQINFVKGSSAVPKIVIDPGHGGHDPGAKSKVTGTQEKTYALKTGLLLRDQLVQRGYDVVMTRDSDFYPTLTDRAKLANDLDADIFISIHYNSAKNTTKPSGIETLVYQTPDNKQLALFVHNQLISSTGVLNRGLKNGNKIIVLNRTKVPAILVELGFLTNPNEAKRIHEDDYQHILANALATGIDKYFGR